MSWTAVLVLVASLQGPAPQGEAAAAVAVELQGGGVLEGTVRVDTEDYLELALPGGAVVGFDKGRIAKMERRAPAAAEADLKPTPALDPRDQWYVVHDAAGRAVGRLHGTVVADADGHIRLGEEWEFRRGSEAIGITKLEVVTQALEPLSCFYHERTRRQDDGRTVQERLVRAEVVGNRLQVETTTLQDRSRRSYPWRKGMRFPLAVLEMLRQQRQAGDPVVEVDLFDPGREELVRRRYTARLRRPVQSERGVVQIRELQYQHQGRSNTEWIDASCRTLRRELNGLDLVAVPASESEVDYYLRAAVPVVPPAMAVEAEHQFALWLPNPSWQAVDSAPGRVAAVAPLFGATACLIAFEQIGGEVLPDSAADTVERWLQQAKPGYRAEPRSPALLRGLEAVRLRGSYRESGAAPDTEHECEVLVFRVHGRVMGLCFDAPRAQFDRLRADFARMERSVELHPGGIARLATPPQDAEPGAAEPPAAGAPRWYSPQGGG